MPLTRKHKATTPTTTEGDQAYSGNASQGYAGPAPAVGAAAGGAEGHYEGHTAMGTARGAGAGDHHATTHPTPAADQGIACHNVHATGAQTHPSSNHGIAGAGQKKLVGKIEHVAGSVLCSSTLKAKGIEKEREAEALKVQAAAIGAAEHLEREAATHRQRAVAHGAHPHHLGGGAGATGGAHHAGGAAPMGDTYGGGIPPTGAAGGPANMNAGPGGAGNLGPQGTSGIR